MVSRWRRVQIPRSARFCRRGLSGTSRLTWSRTSEPWECESPRRHQFRGVVGISIHGVFKKRWAQAHAGATPAAATTLPPWLDGEFKIRCPSWACACDSRRGHQFFGEWWNAYTRVSETRGRKPVQVRILSRRPLWGSEVRVTSSEKTIPTTSDRISPQSISGQ